MLTRINRKKLIICAASVLAAALLLCCVYAFSDWGLSDNRPVREYQRRTALISAAESWLGCMESDNSHAPIIDLYNSQETLPMNYEVQYTDSWCATFVSAAAMKAGLTDIIPVECGCQRQIDLLQNMGIWQEKDAYFPTPGDLIYYAWDEKPLGDCTGWADHVGIVVGTRWPFVKVLEGNKDDRVDYRTTTIWDPTIRGYGLPDFS